MFREDLIIFLNNLNQNYAAIITVIISAITAGTTIIYLYITNKQVYLSKQSIRAIEDQIRLGAQPCVIPKIESAEGTKCFTDYGRRQLHININVKNIGNSPAISLFAIGYLRLQHTKNERHRIVNMDFLPDYATNLSVQESENISIRFETKEIKLLIEDLKLNMNLNLERIRTNPTRPHYRGTEFVIQLLYKNIIGQWFESKLITEISWLINTSKNAPKNKTHNLNENTIPPKELTPEMSFKLQFTAPRWSPIEVNTTDVQRVKNILAPYRENLPHFHEILDASKEYSISD